MLCSFSIVTLQQLRGGCVYTGALDGLGPIFDWLKPQLAPRATFYRDKRSWGPGTNKVVRNRTKSALCQPCGLTIVTTNPLHATSLLYIPVAQLLSDELVLT